MPILSHLLFQHSPAKSSASEPQGMRAPVDHKIGGGFHPPHTQPLGTRPHRLPNARPEGLSAKAAGIHPTIPAARLPTGLVKIRHFGLTILPALISTPVPIVATAWPPHR